MFSASSCNDCQCLAQEEQDARTGPVRLLKWPEVLDLDGGKALPAMMSKKSLSFVTSQLSRALAIHATIVFPMTGFTLLDPSRVAQSYRSLRR